MIRRCNREKTRYSVGNMLGVYEVIHLEKPITGWRATIKCSICGAEFVRRTGVICRAEKLGKLENCSCKTFFARGEHYSGCKKKHSDAQELYLKLKRRFADMLIHRKKKNMVMPKFSFEDVINAIGLPPEETEHVHYYMDLNQANKTEIVPTDFYWHPHTKTETLKALSGKNGLSYRTVVRQCNKYRNSPDLLNDVQRRRDKDLTQVYYDCIGQVIDELEITDVQETHYSDQIKIDFSVKCTRCKHKFVRHAWELLRGGQTRCNRCLFRKGRYTPVEGAITVAKNSSCTRGAILYQRMKKHLSEDPYVKKIKEETIGFYTLHRGTQEFMELCIDADLTGHSEELRQMFYI